MRVRQQYEENPYPRWVRPQPMPPAPGIAAFLRAVFPLAPVTDIAEPTSPRILIAGCGTGQQPIDTARRFPHARVLAIDLSRASLAYAQRKAAELGIANIEFAQADIMAFEPEHRFDLVEASGVLHHLADPMQGWSRITQWLKPGGAMRVGLYSEHCPPGRCAGTRVRCQRRLRRFGRKYPLLPAEPRQGPRPAPARAHRLAGLLQHQRVPRPAVPRAGAPPDLAADRASSSPSSTSHSLGLSSKRGSPPDTGPNFLPTSP